VIAEGGQVVEWVVMCGWSERIGREVNVTMAQSRYQKSRCGEPQRDENA